MANVTIDARQWDSLLSKMKRKFINPSVILKPIASVYGLQDIDDHFQQEMGSKGKWAPLKPSTLKRRIKGRRRISNKALQDTGTLINSIMPARIVNRTTVSMIANPKSRKKKATNINYSGIHNYGQGVPQREFMWLSKEAMDNILKDFLQEILP